MSLRRDSRKNARISVKVLFSVMQRREILIDLVEVKEMTVSKAARKINIKRSTARMIIKKYRETGKVFRKKMNSKESQENTLEKMAKQ